MFWPIRNQIFVPFAAILVVTVSSIAVIAAMLAAQRSERQTIQHLHQVIETLVQSSFPLTPAVLDKMRGLSGADFVVWDRDSRIVASTLPEAWNDELRKVSVTSGLASLAGYPTLTLRGQQYRAAAVERPPSSGTTALWVLYPELSWKQARWEAAAPPLAVGGVTIVLMVLASAWLAQRLGRRIRSVQRQVAAIAAGNFFEVHGGLPHDEIQELVASVNRMCHQLRGMRDTIRQSERTRLLGQLAGGLAHQLRNAVTGARMAVQIHMRRCRVEGNDRSLEVALRQLSLTEEQVKGFLSLGRSERGELQMCDAGRLMEEVVTLIGPNCEHAGVELRHAIAADLPEFAADIQGLRAAVLNLALNAIEAACPQGAVGLSVQVRNGSICWEICDNGPGPRPEVAETLFDPFVSDKPEGVGIGLALAHQVASDHGGRLSWERRDGETAFALFLPISDNAPTKGLVLATGGVRAENGTG